MSENKKIKKSTPIYSYPFLFLKMDPISTSVWHALPGAARLDEKGYALSSNWMFSEVAFRFGKLSVE